MTKSSLPPEGKTPEYDAIYVDLDCLLDTRLGTLASLKDDYAVNALKNGYFERDMDEFPDAPHNVFRLAYDKRDVDTLMRSRFTNVFVLLQSIIKGTFETAVTNPNTKPLRIVVNVAPYDLMDEEKAAITSAVARHIKEMADVELVNVSDGFLTPQYCKDNFAMMVRYDYEPWLKIHTNSKAFETVKMPNVSMIVPALYQKRPTDQELAELKEINLHPFAAVEFALAPFFSLRLVDINTFCISDKVADILEALEKIQSEPKKEDGIKSEEPKPSGQNAVKSQDESSEGSDGFELL